MNIEKLQTIIRLHRLAHYFACSLSSALKIMDQRNELKNMSRIMRMNIWLHAALPDRVRSSGCENRLLRGNIDLFS